MQPHPTQSSSSLHLSPLPPSLHLPPPPTYLLHLPSPPVHLRLTSLLSPPYSHLPTLTSLHSPPYSHLPTLTSLLSPPYTHLPTLTSLLSPPYSHLPTLTSLLSPPYSHLPTLTSLHSPPYTHLPTLTSLLSPLTLSTSHLLRPRHPFPPVSPSQPYYLIFTSSSLSYPCQLLLPLIPFHFTLTDIITIIFILYSAYIHNVHSALMISLKLQYK